MSNEAATVALRAARDLLVQTREDHDAALGQFTWPDVGEEFNWAHDWFDQILGSRNDDGLVIVEENGECEAYSFQELSVRSNKVARWLGERGVGKGQPVVVMLDNQVELWLSMLAVMKLGAIVVPTTSAVGAEELADRVGRSGATLVICNDRDAAKTDRCGVDVVFAQDLSASDKLSPAPVDHPHTLVTDPLLYYFTSGTTSSPKLVEHSQISYPLGHLSTLYWIGLLPGDRHLNVSSPGWAKHAWSSFFAPWLAEATIVVLNYTRFDAANLISVLREWDVTTLCAPPTVWRMLISDDLGGVPGSLREVLAAGEPLNPEVIEQVRRAWGLTVRDGFGQTETTAQIGNPPGSQVKPGSMGRRLPGVPVVLVDPVTGKTSSIEGEICLDLSQRPLSLMTGYRDDSERQDEAMAGGFYHTGDVASVDADGYITFIGRTDDVFKASDYKISPFELESALLEHPAIAEAAVVPAPDPVRLAVPKAYVSLVKGIEANRDTAFDIFKFARGVLAPYQRVRRLEFSQDLPKTISGKIRRSELRAWTAEGKVSEYRDDEFPELKS